MAYFCAMSKREPRPFEVEYIDNPDQQTLRALASEHTPSVLRSKVGSIDKISRNKSRMAKYTYIIASEHEADRWNGKTMLPEKAQGLIDRQRAYIKQAGALIAIDGYIGVGPRALGATWLYTLEGANIAGMQQILAFDRKDVESPEQLARPFEPTFRLIYTPDLMLDDMPGRQAIIVDMDEWTTYVMGPDYFGESKKGVLRMLNEYIYQQGGLVLHAGAKAVTRSDGEKMTVTVMGLSGTGKTTTTFSKQGDLTEPVQDDMVVLWPKGELSITENGCFAKIEGLSEETEPIIYRGTVSADAWVENGFLNEDGTFDFFKLEMRPEDAKRYRDILVATGAAAERVDQFISGEVSYSDVVDEDGIPKDGWDFVQWTQNGRSIIPMSSIPGAADVQNLPPVRSMGILNRDEGQDAATPGIVRFASPEQAAGYFMLGETSKTSAAGKDRGKTRSPFTQPFFPGQHGLQAKRFREIASTMPEVGVWMMNTGYVGGDARDVQHDKALKIKIRHSSAMLEALLSDSIAWTSDEDFGYDVVDLDSPKNEHLLSLVPAEILRPKVFFEKNGRLDEYKAWVSRMNEERRNFLRQYNVDPEIEVAVCR